MSVLSRGARPDGVHPPAAAGLPEVSVCICTFRRPQLLDGLLAALAAQTQAHDAVEFVVVDNDPQGSAAGVLARWRERLPLQALHLPVPNIAAARNAAVAAARGAWIAFIDDDESPDARWLATLRAAQQAYGADVVFGPVVPRYVEGTPSWLRRGGFFDRPRFPTGTAITTRDARTGNVLIRRGALDRLCAGGNGPFDTAFGRTGAEDTMLFHGLLADGARLVWCDEATVQEEVPLARANPAWLLRRSYRLGQTYLLSEMARRTGAARWRRAAWLGLRACGQGLLAAALALLLLPVSRIRAMRWLRAAVAQAGKLSAIAGHRYHEYGG